MGLGIKTLLKKIDGGTLIAIGKKLPKPKSMQKADGYILATSQGQKIVVRAEKFKGLFPDRRQPRLVLNWLVEIGAATSSRKPKSATEILWAARHKTWPDGSRKRSIVIDLSADIRNSLSQ